MSVKIGFSVIYSDSLGGRESVPAPKPTEAKMRKERSSKFLALGVGILLGAVRHGRAPAAPPPIFGRASQALSGDVQKCSWPRRALHLTAGKTAVAPALALGSWAA